jgi:sugar fermentation stimulation protein A
LRAANKAGRKTSWSAVLCESPEGDSLVSLDSTLPNRLVGRALAAGALTEFKGWSLVRPEFPLGASRWDFLLANAAGRQLLLEVKSVTLVEDKAALFPDALTARGAKHMRELAHIVRDGAYDAAVLFVAQREEAEYIRAAPHIDPVFAAALADAKAAGVCVYGRKCSISLTGVTLGESLPAG